MSWLDDVLSEPSQIKLRGRVQRKYGGFPEWEEYFQSALSKLWDKLQHHKEADVTQALLHTTFDNLVIDSHRKLYRYSRPRKWLRNYGQIGLDIFKFKCIKGESNNTIHVSLAESMREKGISEKCIAVELDLATSILDQIDAIDDCNYGRHDRVSVEEIDQFDVVADSDDSYDSSDPLSSMKSMEISVLLEFLLSGEQSEGVSMKGYEALIEQAKTRHLSDEQRLILQLSYREGYTNKVGAEILNMEPHTYRRRRDAALGILKDLFDH